MKEIIKVDYYCEYCGKNFKNKEECAIHEEDCATSHPRISRGFAKQMSEIIRDANKHGVEFVSCVSEYGEIGAAVYDSERKKIILLPF